ncbi:hypothetical protein AVEN_199118-1 [Araneus ventricosus]|uniref:SMB domain-containing protein n=1 Tax=Araneus ventricosus TaxID=182803 RepID=A0A4Y2VCM8_ARAVE|nr:hypothetical protein AVEN_199118-1 [Araneus ventricosus]
MKSFFIAVNMLLPLCTYAEYISYTFDRNDLEAERLQSCLQRNSCSKIANTSLEGIICHCDSECTMFGDCCIDAIRMSSNRTLPQICMNFGNISNQGIYMVNSCPTNYVGPEEIRRLCLNDDFSDIAKSAPVTDFVNRQIYLNRYCAICNEVPLIFVKAWSVSACRIENSSVANFPLSDVTYHATEKKWGYELQGRFHLCKFVFEKPTSAPAIGRSCRLDYISSCPITWNGTDYCRACQSYTAVVKDSNGIQYKNPHCAICSGVTLSDIVCLSNDRRDFSSKMVIGPMDINTAFSRMGINTAFSRMGINKAFGANRPPGRLCPEGQRFDRYFGICRTIVCAFQGYSIRNGKCVKG